MTYNVFSGTLNPTQCTQCLALAHPGGPGKRAVKRLWLLGVISSTYTSSHGSC